MKIANFKALAAKVVTVGLLAGAVAVAAPKAEAQVVVRFGGPVVYAPAPVYQRGFYGPEYRFRHEVVVPRYERFHRGYWR